jgi:formylglycine-generating enzyme required for sulfatase activity
MHPTSRSAALFVILPSLLGAVVFGTTATPQGSPHSVATMHSGGTAQVLNLWRVDGAAPGATVKLWAQVQNNGVAALPSNAQVWFYVNGPNWTGSHWVSSASVSGLAPGTDQWYASDWAIPSNAVSGSYAYWAQVFVASIEISDWSAEQDFSVSGGGSLPGKATLISPSGNISTTTPSYVWNAIANSTWYYLWVNDGAGTGKIAKWYTADQAGCASGSGTCSVMPATPLAAGAGQWWIHTWNSSGTGPWSDGMAFTVGGGGVPGKAALLSPTGTISTATPTYSWNAVSNATYYYLWVSDSTSAEKIKTWYAADQSGCASGNGTCSMTPATTLAAGACQWWIQTWNSSGYGPWSDGMAFTVGGSGPPGKAALISPSGTIITSVPEFTWSPVTGATRYLQHVNDSAASGKISQSYSAQDAGCDSGAANCIARPKVTLASGAAQWWIQAQNASGGGPWSDAMDFFVAGTETGPYGIQFVALPAGEFQMGSDLKANEQPIHRVVISKSFQLGKYEITQGQWKAVMGTNPSNHTGDDTFPVETVSWIDVQTFIGRLNALNDGYRYRLPTEAEWEYACRAGTTGEYAENMDDVAWYLGNSGGKTHPVGTKKPNAWGLYDMHGNVGEWVQDWFSADYYSKSLVTDPPGPTSGIYRAWRSGAFNWSADWCRSGFRYYSDPGTRGYQIGVRLLRTRQ